MYVPNSASTWHNDTHAAIAASTHSAKAIVSFALNADTADAVTLARPVISNVKQPGAVVGQFAPTLTPGQTKERYTVGQTWISRCAV